MSMYKTILVAVDVSAEARQVLGRAMQLAADQGQIYLMHVVEPVITENSFDLITSLPVELQETLHKQARGFLQGLCDEVNLPHEAIHIETGSVKQEILRVARELHAEVIVIGTHGRHGVSMLLGSTANSILHGTPCDVLAVRIEQQSA